MSSQYGELRPLTAEIGSGVCSTPANFNGFRVLASLLHRRHSTDVNQTLHDVWPSPGLVYYIYIFGVLAPSRSFSRCKIYVASESCVILYWQGYCTALQQWASTKLRGVVQWMELRNFGRGRHLYSTGRPSHSALAHISSFVFIFCCTFLLIGECVLLLY